MFNFINKNTNYDINKKVELTNTIAKLKRSDDFLMDSLAFYTSESEFMYFFNRTMRNVDKSLTRLSYLIGPMYYSMVRYLETKYPDFKLNKSMILYRKIIINKYDLNLYQISQHNIICFPSFTSTSINKNFSTTKKAKKVNQINLNEEVELLLIIKYHHNPSYSNQGMVLNGFSVNQHEEEILLFPFTFVKAHLLNKVGDKKYELECTIINKDRILEFGLKKDRKVVLKNNILTIQ